MQLLEEAEALESRWDTAPACDLLSQAERKRAQALHIDEETRIEIAKALMEALVSLAPESQDSAQLMALLGRPVGATFQPQRLDELHRSVKEHLTESKDANTRSLSVVVDRLVDRHLDRSMVETLLSSARLGPSSNYRGDGAHWVAPNAMLAHQLRAAQRALEFALGRGAHASALRAYAKFTEAASAFLRSLTLGPQRAEFVAARARVLEKATAFSSQLQYWIYGDAGQKALDALEVLEDAQDNHADRFMDFLRQAELIDRSLDSEEHRDALLQHVRFVRARVEIELGWHRLPEPQEPVRLLPGLVRDIDDEIGRPGSGPQFDPAGLMGLV